MELETAIALIALAASFWQLYLQYRALEKKSEIDTGCINGTLQKKATELSMLNSLYKKNPSWAIYGLGRSLFFKKNPSSKALLDIGFKKNASVAVFR